ncbi:MAG: pentapeptide repeat-containing protein [Thermoplasmata archaeon]
MIGTFTAENGVTGEVSANGPGGGPACSVGTSNCYGLQINTNQFPTVYASSGGPINTTGSEQFVYQDSGSSAFMAIWEIVYGFTSCPNPSPSGFSSWDLDLGNCYAHTSFVTVPAVPVTNLSQVSMTAYANQSGSDALVFCVVSACTATSGADAIGLGYAWTVAEFNVFGDNGGSQAAFNGGAALQVETQIDAEGGSSLAPTCAGQPGVHTVEDNNLFLWPCSAGASSIQFWEANESFGLSSSPSGATVQAGQAATYSVGFTSFSGFAAPVRLTLTSPLPPGVTSSFPATVTPPSVGTLTLGTSPSTPLGDYSFTIQAQIASLTGGPGPIATTTVSLHLYNFTVAISPGGETVLRGVSVSYLAQLDLQPGSTLVGLPLIVLSVSGVPGDASVSGLNPAGYTIGYPTPTTVPFSVATAPAPAGSLGDFAFVVTGTPQGYPAGAANAGAVLHIYDFGVSLTPASETVLRGANPAVYYVDLTLAPSSTSVGIPAEALSVSGLPVGTPAPTFSVGAVTPTFAGCTPPLCPTLTVSTAPPPSGSLGDSSVQVTATDLVHGGARSESTGLHIFDFVASPTPSEALFQGEMITVKVSLPLDPGSSVVGLPSASLTLTGLPSGVVAVGFPSSLTVGGSQTFTLETASVGSYISCPQVSSHGGQNLKDADLAHCLLAGYDLMGDNLQYANLSGAKLSNADLAGDNLQYADLASANTSGADFQGSNMQYVDLTAAGAVGTFTLTVTATVDGGTRIGYSTLTVWGDQISGDNFQGNNLQYADLAGDLAVSADFAGDNLQHTNLAGADLQGADFKGDNLQYVDLAGAILTGLGPLASQLTNFNGVNLQYANFAGAVCGTPNYITASGSNLQHAVGISSTCAPALDPPLSPAVGPLSLLFSPSAPLALTMVGEMLAGLLGAILILRQRPPPH